MGISTGAAILGAGVLGAGASIASGALSSGAASSAASTQAQAADQASANQLAEFQQIQKMIQPFVSAGSNALNPLESSVIGGTDASGNPVAPNPFLSTLENSVNNTAAAPTAPTGLPGQTSATGLAEFTPGPGNNPSAALVNLASFTPGAPNQNGSLTGTNSLLGLNPDGTVPAGGINPAAMQATLAATPGYQFTLQQGLEGVQNGFAAEGLANSGAALKGAAGFTTGLANQTYEQQLNNYLTSYNNQYANAQNNYNTQYNSAFDSNQLAFNQASTGYGSTAGVAQNLVGTGANAGVGVGTIGNAATQASGNYLTSGAAASAAGTVGSTNALTNGLTGATGSLGGSAVLNALLTNKSSSSDTNPLSIGTANPLGSGETNTTSIYSP